MSPIIDDLLADFDFNFGPLPSPDASNEEQEAFDLALAADSSNTAEAATNQTATEIDNGSDQCRNQIII